MYEDDEPVEDVVRVFELSSGKLTTDLRLYDYHEGARDTASDILEVVGDPKLSDDEKLSIVRRTCEEAILDFERYQK